MNRKPSLKWLLIPGALLFLCITVVILAGGATWLTSRGDQTANTSDTPSGFSFSDLFKGNKSADSGTPDTASAPNTTSPGATVTNQTYIPVFTKPLVSNPNTAALQTLHGLVQLQQADGSWQTVQTTELTKGQTIRTWDFSSAVITFFDGSYVLIDAQTRLTLETVNAPANGERTITLFQPYGQTTHNVAQQASNIAYDVRTPSALGSATGTIFEVTVHDDKSSQINVVEGTVEVTGQNAAVELTTGQTTSVEDGDNPTDPVFWVSGEGEVTQTGEVWIIGGLDFQVNAQTIITGDPQVGDIVSVRGYLLPDGTRLADRILLLTSDDEEHFRLTGLVESMGADAWVISGQEIRVNETTEIDPGIEVGSRVLVIGIIRDGGQLFAESITLLDEETTHFEFTGLVEAIDGRFWTIGGTVIATHENTVITGDPVVGDLLHVTGRIQEDGTWLARTIEKVNESSRFEIIGLVETIAPWVVSGTSFEVNEFTQIEPGVVVGSLVRVTGTILEDGTWLARSIELLDGTNTLVFIGIVGSIDPWSVDGHSLVTDENTVLVGDIVVGSLVRVTVQVQLDGTWLALRIELIEIGPVVGCVEFVDVVTGLTDNEIILASGVVIPRALAEIEGDLEVGSQVVVKLCFGPDDVLVFAWIFVVEEEIRPTPTPGPTRTPGPTGTPPPIGDDKVTICHIPPGNPGNAHTITVGASAVDAHLAHGDHLGPCTGDEGGGRDDDKKNNGNKDD
ncbi:MAG TPA: DUF5666 domain-containing protein [Anaerolineales bacterium]|nr:DUF5666 domain-containing protein [Anaerolineales bacterium]